MDKRKHSQVDDSNKELWRVYNEKLSKFGVYLEFYFDEQVCTICQSLMRRYGGVEGVSNKRRKPVLTSLAVNGAVANCKNCVFETKICKHHFHLECAKLIIFNQPSDQYFECPMCKTIQGIKIGNQPDTGRMSVTKENYDLPGYGKSSSLNFTHNQHGNAICTSSVGANGTYVVEYAFDDGIQNDSHPNPGSPYQAHSFPRKAYIPATTEGTKIVRMLRLAFDRKLIFTVGKSATSGKDNVIVWNGIHHKTQIAGTDYGYPDPQYLERVKKELNAMGITENDVQISGDNKI